ncbi:helix-turn-helix transcriptional regulator [Botrimarina sp.]|uniref:helix-turn-helix domain-containing protein n=1 Tax=Botrimarina sp. TaxID=2795802 RepID=UPI0032EF274B
MPDHPIADRLREAVLADPQSYNALSRETGIARPTLTRFADAVGTLRLDHAETLCRFYGLELRPTKERNA